MMIGAYRDNEVHAGHLLQLLFAAQRGAST
jgi:hypothetical protein